MARYDFDQGLPDPDLYPVDLLAGYYAAVLGDDGADACNYFSGRHGRDMRYGHHGLREAIAEWLLANQSCHVEPDGVLLANGSTNGIAMAINATVGPGDALIVEELSYPYAAAFARTAGATVLTVPLDDDGMDVEHLDTVCRRAVAEGLRPRMVYTVATFQSPTGSVLPVERRRVLLDVARRFGALILEDNCYHHLWYDRPPAPSLLALDDGATVIQSGSFSKYLAPGLRMAWLAGDPHVIAGIAATRQDFAVSQVTARVVERFVRHGDLDRHLERLRSAYRDKRDTAACSLAAHCGEYVDVRVPVGGFYYWLSVRPEVDFEAAMARAEAVGVGFRPGVCFQHGPGGGNHLRLSVAQSPLADIDPGLALLGRALQESVR